MNDSVLIATLAALTMLTLAIVMAWVLGWAKQAFHVETDPRVDRVNELLPGANCGGCGYVGCLEYAEAVVAGKAAANLCPVGGTSCAQEIAAALGLELEERFPYRPVVHCGATTGDRLKQTAYRGEHTCRAGNIVAGIQGCAYGCIGFGDCVVSCDYDAIHIVDGLSKVDYAKCIGCGACARVCPRNIIHMIPFKSKHMMVVACSNRDPGKAVKEVCKVGCIGCKGCTKRSGIFDVKDNLATVDYDQYDPDEMDAAELIIDKCPMKGIVFVGIPTAKDVEQVKDEHAPALVEAEFKTTVDDTEWQG
jgi:Na+-translocating ferredoxin:NAD+ oxidoreductase subunit B